MSRSRQSRSIAAFVIALFCFGGSDEALLALVKQPASQPAPVGPQKPGAQPAEQTLPGGASQVQETYGDWRVTCVQQNGQKVCALMQQQADKDSRQLVLGIELKTTTAGRAEGTMVLPFGLAVDKPIVLQIDEGASQTTHFRTCVPVGCLVAVAFDSATISSLKKGTMLNVKATGEGGQEAMFKVSLKGFAGAFDRTEALTK